MSDLERMLRRVVLDGFDDDVEVAWSSEPGAPHIRRVTLSAGRGADRRTVGLRAAETGFFEIAVLDLGVSGALVAYDDERYMEAILHELALVARAYLRGEGLVEWQRGLLRNRPVLMLTVDGKEWALGRRTSKVHYPAETPE